MEQTTFSLEIITPTQTQQHTVEWVEIESITGSFFVGPSHFPLISMIKNQSEITYKVMDTEPAKVVATQGIFYVEKNKAVVILN